MLGIDKPVIYGLLPVQEKLAYADTPIIKLAMHVGIAVFATTALQDHLERRKPPRKHRQNFRHHVGPCCLMIVKPHLARKGGMLLCHVARASRFKIPRHLPNEHFIDEQ